jgi:large subunit ribosomal protein L21
MFAVVRTGGKQYRVHPGDTIVVEKLAGDAGDKVTLGDVLLAGDGGKLEPTNGLTVAAEIVAQGKGDKVTVFKKRRRHNYRRKKGHRQQHTILRIVAVGDHKAEKPAKPAKADAAPKPAGDPAKTDTAETKAVKTKAAAIKPATVSAEPTENPAPANQAQANPPAQSVDAPSKTAKTKAKDKPTAKTPSTKNAALAKGGAKKSPKAK